MNRIVARAMGAALLMVPGAAPVRAAGPTPVVEYAISWPAKAAPRPGAGAHGSAIGDGGGGTGVGGHGAMGSTHEIAVDPGPRGGYWISGQDYDHLVHVSQTGRMRFYPTGQGSRPHGLAFDGKGRLWVTLEGLGRIVRLDPEKGIQEAYPVTIACGTCAAPLNPHPHGLALGRDGNLWFTGKATGTVGRLAPGGRVTHFQLPTAGSTPIYAVAGPDGAMWVTELTGNRIARITPAGAIEEISIPTPLSRPIAITAGPDGAMWFSEEAGGRIGRIDRGPDGKWRVLELAVAAAQPNLILAGLAFDRRGDLWVQQYVSNNVPEPPGTDCIVRIDRAGLDAWVRSGADPNVPVTMACRPVPTRSTVMHRVAEGRDGAMWFTEMGADKVGRIRSE